jgi:hypothetical protein
MCPSDTSPETWQVYLKALRAISPGEKLRMTLELTDSMVSASAAGMRHQYPQATEREIFLRVARLRLGRDLFRQVYGDELPDDGKIRRRA